MNQSRRRSFSVTSAFQYRFLAMTIIYGFILVFLVMIAFLGPDVLEMNNTQLSPELRSAAAERMLGKNQWVWPTVILLIVAIGLNSFREFKKIAGPLYRFRWAFEQLENGNLLTHIKIREKDYLVSEEDAINKMLASFCGRFSVIKRETDAALKSIGELECLTDTDNPSRATQIELIRTHGRHLRELSSAIGFFQLPDDPQGSVASMPEDHKNEDKLKLEVRNEPVGFPGA